MLRYKNKECYQRIKFIENQREMKIMWAVLLTIINIDKRNIAKEKRKLEDTNNNTSL